MSKITVNIHGRDYTVTGDRTPEEINIIAGRVDEEMTKIASFGSFNSSTEIAVLAALRLSEMVTETEKNVDRVKVESDRAASEELQVKIRGYEERLKQLQDKVNEYENNFFDLQMENVKLKDELEKIRGQEINI